jgi:hypothetical protein
MGELVGAMGMLAVSAIGLMLISALIVAMMD